MSRVYLVHWKAEEADEHAKRLRAAGHVVTVLSDSGVGAAASLNRAKPEVVVISLDRLPSHGRHLAVWLRERKATRTLPIVFCGGQGDKLARVKRDLPDAVFTEWRTIRSAIRSAIANAPEQPVVVKGPDYSGTPLPKKLGIKAGASVALLSAPDGIDRTIGELPPDVVVRRQARGAFDVIVLFTKTLSDLEKRFPVAVRNLVDRGGLWVAWPKKTSGVATDLTGDVVREFGLSTGLVDNKVCAVDATWSGLRFVRRVK